MCMSFQESTHMDIENHSQVMLALHQPRVPAFANIALEGRSIYQNYYEVNDDHKINNEDTIYDKDRVILDLIPYIVSMINAVPSPIWYPILLV